MKKGQRVRIHTPENPRLHGTVATVREETDYGGVLDAPAAATGQFRALPEEVRAFGGEGGRNGTGKGGMTADQARTSGYTGDVCEACGSVRMVRTGPCVRCENCLTTGGCS